jgi:hypothetical protein
MEPYSKQSCHAQIWSRAKLSACVALLGLSVFFPESVNATSLREIYDIINEIALLTLAQTSEAGDLAATGIKVMQGLPEFALCGLAVYIEKKQKDIAIQDSTGPDPTDFESDPRWDALERLKENLGNGCGSVAAGTFSGQAVGPLDPNQKVGSQGAGPNQYIAGATPLRYVIQFGNETSATAAAQRVVVTDQLDTRREDLNTFNFGSITFGNRLVSPPVGVTDFATTVDLRPTSNLLLAIESHLNVSSGLLTWLFASLDPVTGKPTTDPTAGFLPPAMNGSVFFTVMPRQSLPTNTQIQNHATVTFDANAPISTPTWLNTLDNTAPASHVLALPAVEANPIFTIQWSGNDIGSGVQDFTIYVSDNGGPFVPFHTNVTATAASFTGHPGHTYGFYSIARDLVGNAEAAKTSAEATTQVVTDSTPPTTAISISSGSNVNDWNNSNVTVTLNSTDDEPSGTGVRQINYSATGAQDIGSTVVVGSLASFTIIAEGRTIITFFGTDNAGNTEIAKTVTIKIDKTPPIISGLRIPAANVNGWNNSLVTANFQCVDALSGLAAGSPPAPTILTLEGAGQIVTGTCFDLAGNSASADVQDIDIDLTPPILTAFVNPIPNANKWENADVTVSWSAVDALSGVAAVSGPVTVTAEGAGQLVPGTATDLAGNIRTGSATINLDKTPPEAFFQFDHVTHDVLLFGRDSLSGVPPGPIPPASAIPIGDDDRDDDDKAMQYDDEARRELRTYQVLDLAGNSLRLTAKVRKSHSHLAITVVSLQYGQGSVINVSRNLQSFEWNVRHDGNLKKLEQDFKAGPGEEAQRVEADFDSRRNQTVIRQEEPEPKIRLFKPGLHLIRMATSGGKLSIEF